MPARIREAFTAALTALLVYAVLTSAYGNRYFPALVFALGALYFAVWAFGRGPLHGSLVLAPVGAMALWAWLPGSVAGMRWSAYFVLAFLAVQLFASARLRLRFLQFSVFFGAAYGAFALVQQNGTFLNRNHFAAFMELLLPIAAWQAVKARKAIYAGAGALALISIVISASRAGIVLAGLELVFIAARAWRGQGRARTKPIILTAAAALVLAAAVGGTAWQRFGNLATDAQHSTRGLTARASIAMVRERPWLGFGLGTWETVYPHFAEQDTGFHMIHADDDWLEWTAEGGLSFLAFLFTVAAIAVRNAWREPWSIGLTAVLLHGLTEFPLQKPAVMSWFVVLLASSAMARRQH
jgi:O-antigen ligase